MGDAFKKYTAHKASAKQRGIEFEFTFDEWWAIWEPRFHERGRGAGQLCMCRTKDEGPYAVGNVRLDTPKGNQQERGMLHRVRKHSGIKEKLRWSSRISEKPAAPDWMNRATVFQPYVEEEDT